MRYPVLLALLAAAGVGAQTSGCSEQTKVARCLEAAAKVRLPLKAVQEIPNI